jgi:hypothetical protein
VGFWDKMDNPRQFDPEFESDSLAIAPGVFFAHSYYSYYGTCISGAKTFTNRPIRPYRRRFGPSCLLHYYPHRCGGWSPLTIVREYRRQRDRLQFLTRRAPYSSTLTAYCGL